MAYRATLKDVAAAAGVSVTTVSLVLNNRPARVSEEKRKAIADAAKKLGGSIKFVDAVRFQTGEGIEKKEEDFAAEVAAQMNMGKK